VVAVLKLLPHLAVYVSWFGLKSPAPSAPQNTWSLTNTEFFASPTSSGKTVTERSAVQMTAVYACVRILAEAVASLPLHLYQERAGTAGGKERACVLGGCSGDRIVTRTSSEKTKTHPMP